MALEGARDSCRLFLSRLAFQVEELLLRRYPGDHPGPKQWLNVVGGVIDTAEAYLTASENSALPPDEAKTLVQDANRLARLSYEFIAMASGTGLDELPYPVVLPLQRWFEKPGLINSTIFRAELVANYEIRTVERSTFDRIRNPSAKLTQALAKISWPLKRITVPSRALGMLPHFAVVAHEIGHALFHLVKWDFAAHTAEGDATTQRIRAQVGASVPARELGLYVNEVYLNWLQEIVADAFAHLMSGPAFFFALGGFLQIVGGGLGIGETHPANEVRLDILYENLQGKPGESFTEVYERHVGAPLARDLNSELLPKLPAKADLILRLQSNLRPTGNLTPSVKAIVLAELTDLLKVISPTVYKQAGDYLAAASPEVLYTAATFDNDVREHLPALIQAIPPIESGVLLADRRPTDFAAIINVGWVVLLSKLNELSVKTNDPNSKAEKAEKLHSLLLKAVELSEARRSWERAV